MKKALSVFLACFMLLGMIAVPAVADGEPGNYDSDLLALYDFEGNTPFANKAPNGIAAPLSEVGPTDDKSGANTSASDVLPVENGAVTVSGANYYSLYLPANTRKKLYTDSLYSKTYFAKFKTSGEVVANQTQAIFGHRSREMSLELAAGSSVENGYTIHFQHMVTTANAASASKLTLKLETISADSIPSPVAGQWYYCAMSLGSFDSENSILPVDLLFSNDGKDYTVLHYDIAVDTATLAKSFANCYWNFGKSVHTSKSNNGADFIFDEVAIYNRPLTANELALHTLSYDAPVSDIALVGYQTTTPENNLFNMRLVGSVNNVVSYKEVGITVLISNELGTTKVIETSTTTVYLALNATDSEGNTYIATTAEQQGVEALFALRIEGVPTTGTYTITMIGTAVTTTDAAVNTGSATLTLTDGVLTPAA